MQVLFGIGFLATAPSWVVGFVVGWGFGLSSFVFYRLAVGLAASSLGYAAAVGLLTWIGLDFGFFVWLIAMITGVVLGFVTLWFNLQKEVILPFLFVQFLPTLQPHLAPVGVCSSNPSFGGPQVSGSLKAKRSPCTFGRPRSI